MTELERLTADLAANNELAVRLAGLPVGDVHMAASVLNAEGYRITAEDLTAAGAAGTDGLQPLTDSELDTVAGGFWGDLLGRIANPVPGIVGNLLG